MLHQIKTYFYEIIKCNQTRTHYKNYVLKLNQKENNQVNI